MAFRPYIWTYSSQCGPYHWTQFTTNSINNAVDLKVDLFIKLPCYNYVDLQLNVTYSSSRCNYWSPSIIFILTQWCGQYPWTQYLDVIMCPLIGPKTQLWTSSSFHVIGPVLDLQLISRTTAHQAHILAPTWSTRSLILEPTMWTQPSYSSRNCAHNIWTYSWTYSGPTAHQKLKAFSISCAHLLHIDVDLKAQQLHLFAMNKPSQAS